MATERTLSIIKPDAVAKNVIGKIVSRFEAAGLKIAAAKLVHLSRAEAEQFYGVHIAPSPAELGITLARAIGKA